MKHFEQYVDILIDVFEATIKQMTNADVKSVNKRLTHYKTCIMPFAHIIDYKDYNHNGYVGDGKFVLGFESDGDALKLACAISDRIGYEKFDKMNEDSTDLLNEFLNIVVGRTITEWDKIGFSVKFQTPIFKKNHEFIESNELDSYQIAIEIASDTKKLIKTFVNIQIHFNFFQQPQNIIKNKTILLADDSKVMRAIIAKPLKAHGAKIIEARNGIEAVKEHSKHNPDLTLMDINMPEMGGFKAIEQIQIINPNSKIIIISSSSRRDEIQNAKLLRVSGYLIKPVNEEELIKRASESLKPL